MSFGEIAGYPPGSWFESRKALRLAGLHRHTQAGISGSGTEGADAVVLSGGYEDDEDSGDVIVYTGEGGNNAGRQEKDQTLTGGNLALAANQAQGLPVRVIRGFKHHSDWSPKSGYRYAGLYVVDQYWWAPGKRGFRVYKYRLDKRRGLPDSLDVGPELPQGQTPSGAQSVPRIEVVVQRMIRDTAMIRWVKKIHDYHCQVCDVRLQVPAGPRAEGAHIKPLGRPHNGEDKPGNVLCLCPNHHVLFDEGAFAIADNFELMSNPGMGIAGRLRLHDKHKLIPEYLQYHREHFWQKA